MKIRSWEKSNWFMGISVNTTRQKFIWYDYLVGIFYVILRIFPRISTKISHENESTSEKYKKHPHLIEKKNDKSYRFAISKMQAFKQ